jgi:hypothetical protein
VPKKIRKYIVAMNLVEALGGWQFPQSQPQLKIPRIYGWVIIIDGL